MIIKNKTRYDIQNKTTCYLQKQDSVKIKNRYLETLSQSI